MRTIKIQSLSLRNFKGVRKLDIREFEQETFILGANESGKTTVADSWPFITHGKNSQGETNFSIKTLDKDNNVIPKLEHEVEYGIIVDNEAIKLKKVYREKWVKKRGSTEAEFAGNEAIYEWNDVPMTQRDFQAKMNDIIDEQVLYLISNPLNFCLGSWGDKKKPMWQNQREVLLDIAGDITNEDIISTDNDFKELFSRIGNKPLSEYEKQIKASITKSKKELNTIPTRIDEVHRNMPEDRDFDVIREKIKFKQKELNDVEEKITDKSKAQDSLYEARNKKTAEIHQLKTELQNLEFSIKREVNASKTQDTSKLDELERKIKTKKEAISDYEAAVKRFDNQIQDLEKQRTAKREEFFAENKKNFEFDEGESKCPTCKRAFEAEDIEAEKAELEANFNTAKQQKLNEINKAGGELKAQSEKLQERKIKGEQEIQTAKEDLAVLEEAHKKEEARLDAEVPTKSVDELVKEALESNKDYQSKKSEIDKLEGSLEEVKPVDTSEFKNQKQEISNAIDELKKELAAEDSRKEALKRVDELDKEEMELAQTIADYEKDQFTIQKFNKTKMDALEEKINHRFKLVDFKLFETQVNGGENPTCKALVNGVPFSDLNTAMKINSGLDIINTLCEHYQVTSPVFIDNRESVTDLIESPSQIINLVVDPTKKKLEVKSSVKQLETA